MKKQQQLGMNPSTASNRLVKDTLFRLLCDQNLNKCYHCGLSMTRFNFSIEHKKPWLDSDNPVFTFFDQSNIGFSHLNCNVKSGRRPHTSVIPIEIRGPEYDRKYRQKFTAEQLKIKRQQQYLRTGN